MGKITYLIEQMSMTRWWSKKKTWYLY